MSKPTAEDMLGSSARCAQQRLNTALDRMASFLNFVAQYMGLALIGLLAVGFVVLHVRLRNAKTLSMLVSGLLFLIWNIVSNPLLNYAMPSPSLNSDAAALAHMGKVQLIHGFVAAVLALWFGVSFLLAALSCPKRT